MAGSAGGPAGTGGASGSAGAGGLSNTAGAGAGSGGSSGSGGSGGSGGAPGAAADFQLYGRWDVRQAGKAITVNSGSHLTASFTGTGISAKFDTSTNKANTLPTISYSIDGGDFSEREIADTVELAGELSSGDHQLVLFVRGMSEFDQRWTPPLASSTTFLGFSVEGGNLVPKPRPARTKVEFLGDSITEGVKVLAQGPAGQTGANWTTDGPHNYAALTAQELGFEWRQVGFGRQGLTIGGNGGVPKAQDSFNFFYSGAPRDDWQADIVVINQGTNDGGTSGTAFAPLYKSYLSVVRTGYPQAQIVALRPFNGAFASQIQEQVNALKTAGDAKVFYVDTTGWTSQGDFTDGLHPNASGSQKISERLVAALQALPD